MSLLARGPHTVTVRSRVRTNSTDRGNNPKFELGEPVTVQGVSVQPMTAEEQLAFRAEFDVAPATLVQRVIGRGPWPGGPYSRVTFRGREYDQVGEAQVHSTGRRTGHFTAVIKARKGQEH